MQVNLWNLHLVLRELYKKYRNLYLSMVNGKDRKTKGRKTMIKKIREGELLRQNAYCSPVKRIDRQVL